MYKVTVATGVAKYVNGECHSVFELMVAHGVAAKRILVRNHCYAGYAILECDAEISDECYTRLWAHPHVISVSLRPNKPPGAS